MSDPARGRFLLIGLSRLAGAGGTIFGLVIATRASETLPKAIGIGLALAGLWVMAVVPRALARRWRSGG